MKQSLLVSFALTFMVLVGLGSASSFNIQLSAPSVSSCPCTANTIKADIENLYRDADTFYLSLELPDEWSGFVQPDIMLGSGESETVPIYITPSPCGIDPQTYRATLVAVSAITGDEISGIIDIETFKCHYISIDLGETYRDVCQENVEGKIFGVVLKNEGKFKETFSLSTDTEWAHFSDSSVELKGNEEQNVNLIIEPPEGMAGIHSIQLSVISDSSCASAGETVNVNIRNCYDFEAMLSPAGSDKDMSTSAPNDSNLPSVSISEPLQPDISAEPSQPSDITGSLVAEDSNKYPWESMVVAVIIIIVVLLIIYIVIRG